MGTYTSMRFVGKVEKEYVMDICALVYYKEMTWKELSTKYDFMKNFANLFRSDFIPFGEISAYNEEKYSGGQNMNHLEPWSDVWIFQCDLKNYGGEIETFLKEVASKICTSYTAEVWCEEWNMPVMWIYKDSKLFITDLGDNTND